jgi:hypothetical protein
MHLLQVVNILFYGMSQQPKIPLFKRAYPTINILGD